MQKDHFSAQSTIKPDRTQQQPWTRATFNHTSSSSSSRRSWVFQTAPFASFSAVPQTATASFVHVCPRVPAVPRRCSLLIRGEQGEERHEDTKICSFISFVFVFQSIPPSILPRNWRLPMRFSQAPKPDYDAHIPTQRVCVCVS